MKHSIDLPIPDLVSVIIPSYNHSNYLAEAIRSAYMQRKVDVEIIVVDDGSTDETRQVAAQYPYVKYVYQTNQGLSAARNTGIDNSKGEYLVFLDADDWLLDDALATNYLFLRENKNLAFVSGTYQYVFEKIDLIRDIVREVKDNHYQQFLICNYIGMHAAVMYRRWAFEHYRFDVSLKASEDYDMFLHLARKFPVSHHTKPMAAYRIHGNNMSANIPMMLEYTIKVLMRQEPFLKDEVERVSFEKGVHDWKRWYCIELYKKLRPQPVFTDVNSKEHLWMLWKYNKPLFCKYLVRQQIKLIKWLIKKSLPLFVLKQIQNKQTLNSNSTGQNQVNTPQKIAV